MQQDSSAQLELVINGQDGRTQVLNTDDWPSSAHGLVVTKYEGSSFWGSGTLIASNVVLTAAQNLYCRKSKAFTDSVEFLPALNGHLLPFGKAKVEDFFVPAEYIAEPM